MPEVMIEFMKFRIDVYEKFKNKFDYFVHFRDEMDEARIKEYTAMLGEDESILKMVDNILLRLKREYDNREF